MPDFAGKWKAAQGAGRMIVRQLNHTASDLPSSFVIIGVLTDREGTGADFLESAIEKMESASVAWTDESQFQSNTKQFVDSHSSSFHESHLVVLLGSTDAAEVGLTGSFASSDGKSTGEFAFLLQDENEFIGGLTCQPSLPADGWWLRQNIRRKIQVDDPDAFDS